MSPGGEEHLGLDREILRAAAAPGATMDEDKGRCRGQPGAVDVQPFDLGPSVSDTLGLADTKARRRAVANSALGVPEKRCGTSAVMSSSVLLRWTGIATLPRAVAREI